MNVESFVHETQLGSVVMQNTTGVLVAYADTYFGKRLLHRLGQSNMKPNDASEGAVPSQRYKLLACMWDKNSVHKDKGGDEGSPVTVTPPIAAIAADAVCVDNVNVDVGNAHDSLAATGASVDTKGTKNADDDGGNTCIFWRGDRQAMRHAIIEADFIVMELRQARDVFDMMHVLAAIDLPRPKRIILVSSMLTWFATPPLSVEPLNDGMEENGEHEEGRDDDDDDEEEEEEEERAEGGVRDDQGPRPPNRREVEEFLGPLENAGVNTNDDDADGELKDGNGSAREVELFTEDQYNRRIPHAKYYNWREAERVVTAANNEERQLHTCVVFSGLMYGDGEDALQPFFAQVWNREGNGLPIYGDGMQLVPAVHVWDLVTFIQRLMWAPAPPTLRYMFASDGGNVTWRQMVRAMNYALGGEKTFHVPPENFVLHTNVELFTINLRVDSQTMRDTMPEDEDWVSQAGFVNCIEKIAFEYVKAHNLQPIRVVILGPPLSGKTCVAEALARRHYQLPTFTMERVLEEYKAHIATLKERLELFYRFLCEREKSRQEEAKKRAFLRSSKKKKKKSLDDEEAESREEQLEQETMRDSVTEETSLNGTVKKQSPSRNDNLENEEVDFTLKDEEVRKVGALVEEWLQQCDRATQLRETIAAMERVLAMRVRVQPQANSDALGANNPKKRKEAQKLKRLNRSTLKKGAAGGGGGGGDDDESANEAHENAPYQDKALALMMRWRISRADCRNQGYVLDSFPETLAQARLVFGEEPMDMLEIIEEVPTTPSAAAAAASSGRGGSISPEVNSAPPSIELCDEERLPDFVFVFEAAENYLRDRLTAMSKASGEATGSEGKKLARFEESLAQYRRQFVDSDYSLPNFFECSRTVAKRLTPGGRSPVVKFVKVDAEPLMLPKPPESAFAVEPPGKLELLLSQYIGPPHNFGPTPQEQLAEEIRERNLQEEIQQEEMRVIMEQQKRENEEYMRESMERSEMESARRAIELADRVALEERKAPLRLYLQRNIVPLLSKGLVEVCKTRPDKPVDFLAEWLVRHNPLDDSCFEL